MDVRPEQEHRPPRLPAAGANVAVALRDTPGGGHDQRPRKIRGRLGQDAGRVPDRDPPPGAGWHVDVVEADRVVRDDLEPGARGVEQLVVDPVGQQRQDAVAAGHGAQELVARRRELVLPDPSVGRLRDPRQAVLGDDP